MNGPLAAHGRVEDFLRRVEAVPPRVISVLTAPELARSWVGNRLVVGIGVGFPRDSGIGGFVLRKRDADSPESARSLSRSAAELRQTELEEYGALRARGQTPGEGMAFFVKDASPDAVLAALLVAANVAGVALGTELEPWLDAVDSWDRGHMPNEPFRSWPALASALSHLRLPIEPGVSQEPDGTAFQLVLAFLIQSLLANVEPERMPAKLTGPGQRAIVALERQHQLYEEIHAHSTILELSIPLRDAPDRRVTVDALCCVEFEPSDAVKLFARGDRKRSPSGRGFDVAACYRPRVPGWNRYTVFAQPELGLDLTDLWVELERRETNAYRSASGIERRADVQTPTRAAWSERARLARSFAPADLDRMVNKAGTARKLSSVENYWANPWFLIDDASLVASPGIDENKQPAESSRLDWGDVTDALLAAFQPLGKISVQAVTRADSSSAQTVELLRAPPLDFSSSTPYFRYVHWGDPESSDRSSRSRAIQLSRFTLQNLAALAGSAKDAEIRPDRLPPPAACKLLELNGGFAVIAQRGCLVANDWHTESLDEKAVLDVLERISSWCACLDAQLETLKEMDRRFQVWLHGNRADQAVFALIGDLAQQRAQFAVERASASLAGVTDPNARLLYDEVLRFWGVPAREALVDQGHARLEQSVRSMHEARTARLLKFVGLVSFPVFVAPTFAKPTVDLANTWLLSRGWQVATGETAKSLLGGAEFVAWLGWAVLLYFGLRRTLAARGPSRTPGVARDPE